MPELSLELKLAELRARIEAAARRVGRNPADVGLVAVTKGVAAPLIRRAHAAKVRYLGENRVQEALAKRSELSDLDLDWHLIGHLQTNKVGDAVGRFALFHGVDSLRLLAAIGRQAERASLRQRILLQVNVSADPAKFGFCPEHVARAVEIAQATEGVVLEGFMTIGPRVSDPEDARKTFAGLKNLRDQVAPGLGTLSMGMTHDFEVAVEEGATLVRVGTGIFGRRDQGQEAD